MPSIKPARLANIYLNEKLSELVQKDGKHTYIGFTRTVSDDMKLSLLTYAHDKNNPEKVVIVKVSDLALIRVAHNNVVPAEWEAKRKKVIDPDAPKRPVGRPPVKK